MITSQQHTIFYSERSNPYSWSIDYWDDWRCIADYLREQKNQKEYEKCRKAWIRFGFDTKL